MIRYYRIYNKQILAESDKAELLNGGPGSIREYDATEFDIYVHGNTWMLNYSGSLNRKAPSLRELILKSKKVVL